MTLKPSDFDWGKTPGQALEGLAASLKNTAAGLSLIPSQEVLEYLEGICRGEPKDPAQRHKDMVKYLDHALEWVAVCPRRDTLYSNCLLDHIASHTVFNKYAFFYNKETVYDCFKGTEIFPTILEALGIMKSLDEVGNNILRTSSRVGKIFSDKDTIIELFGPGELRFYEDDYILQDADYAVALAMIMKYFQKIAASKFETKLRELAYRLQAYKDFFVDPATPEQAKVLLSDKVGWQPPAGYIGSKTVVHDHRVPRPTLQGWQNKYHPKVERDPQSQEVYYPEEWIIQRLKNYTPRRRN